MPNKKMKGPKMGHKNKPKMYGTMKNKPKMYGTMAKKKKKK